RNISANPNRDLPLGGNAIVDNASYLLNNRDTLPSRVAATRARIKTGGRHLLIAGHILDNFPRPRGVIGLQDLSFAPLALGDCVGHRCFHDPGEHLIGNVGHLPGSQFCPVTSDRLVHPGHHHLGGVTSRSTLRRTAMAPRPIAMPPPAQGLGGTRRRGQHNRDQASQDPRSHTILPSWLSGKFSKIGESRKYIYHNNSTWSVVV